MGIENDIKKLEKRINKLEKNSVPNQDLKNLKNRLVNRVRKGEFVHYELDEGYAALFFPKIYQMLRQIEDKGNFYILLCGAKCSTDVAMFEFNTKKDPDEVLSDLNIKKIFDTRIPTESAYLIALNKISQKNIPDKNITMFVRR